MNYREFVETYQKMQEEQCQQRVLQDQKVESQQPYQGEKEVLIVTVIFQNFRIKDLLSLDLRGLKQLHSILQKNQEL